MAKAAGVVSSAMRVFWRLTTAETQSRSWYTTKCVATVPPRFVEVSAATSYWLVPLGTPGFGFNDLLRLPDSLPRRERPVPAASEAR